MAAPLRLPTVTHASHMHRRSMHVQGDDTLGTHHGCCAFGVLRGPDVHALLVVLRLALQWSSTLHGYYHVRMWLCGSAWVLGFRVLGFISCMLHGASHSSNHLRKRTSSVQCPPTSCEHAIRPQQWVYGVTQHGMVTMVGAALGPAVGAPAAPLVPPPTPRQAWHGAAHERAHACMLSCDQVLEHLPHNTHNHATMPA